MINSCFIRSCFFFVVLIIFLGCNKEKAIRYYEKAIKLEDEENFVAAIKQLDQVIELDPEFAIAYLDRAIDKSILGDYQGAIEDLDQVIELEPDAIEPYVWRSEYKRALDQFEEALKDAEIALKLKNPIMIGGVIELELDDQFSQLENKNFDIELEYILYERAVSNFILENYEAAFNDLNYCIKKQLNLKECMYMRGVIYLAIGEKSEGCKDLNAVEKMEVGYAAELLKEYCE